MFDTICTLPLSSDLFTQAIHPTEPIVSVGLSSGRVQTFRLPPTIGETDEDGGKKSGGKIGEAPSKARNGFGHIDTVWETRRHKGSCRCLGFGVDGEKLYSAGTDGLVKIAKSETGVVESKIAIPELKERYVLSEFDILFFFFFSLWDRGEIVHCCTQSSFLLIYLVYFLGHYLRSIRRRLSTLFLRRPYF